MANARTIFNYFYVLDSYLDRSLPYLISHFSFRISHFLHKLLYLTLLYNICQLTFVINLCIILNYL